MLLLMYKVSDACHRACIGIIIQYLIGPTSVILSTAPIVQKTLGSQLNLTCWFDGIPTPNITWLVNGSMLNSSLPHLSVSFEGNSVSLQFVTIKLTDIGIYSCRGYNGFGSIVFSNVTIIVQSKQCNIFSLLFHLWT